MPTDPSVVAPELAISAAARRDLDAIFDYTVERWGLEQADRYVGSFDAAYAKLLGQLLLGSAPERVSGYRKLRPESHLIFYRVGRSTLHTERILHHRMSAVRHL
ncbi:type II toxin-antitoxin system RelE/ParE family toxin [Sphingomonas sp. M1-B02]|uniref:type II toxin-antitoxin system RelE/ParE family toxin n=1 Tax=Sphingomonas sp. M1-B02 TaxID=3114300 RepID=UPI00223F714B|nr:type II toxin-antitoxin system RelE/ParE family toxin [Sphingomonas sp. S6-11]UZK66511.1 type II toxin-antitoxin system RelE/ParE family toxin [Sphingomonas sp. S6-11]